MAAGMPPAYDDWSPQRKLALKQMELEVVDKDINKIINDLRGPWLQLQTAGWCGLGAAQR